MCPEIGKLVISSRGRDKSRVLAVIGSTQTHLILADGRKRRMEKPKMKKIKHVELLGVELSPETLALLEKNELTNRMLYRSIQDSLKSENS